MGAGVAIRRLAEADRSAAAHVYVVGLGDEEVRPLMPRHMDRGEAIFAELIQPATSSWVAESDEGEGVGLALCQVPPASASSMESWSTYPRHLPLLAALRAPIVANYLYRVRLAEDAVYLQSPAVSQERQRPGVGSALVDFVCGNARQCGFAKVRLNVVQSNERVRLLYEHLGLPRMQTISTGFYRHLVRWASPGSMEERLVRAEGCPLAGAGGAARPAHAGHARARDWNSGGAMGL
jgi:ribosomal protein S18 acetylase RimI-like enzyme